MHTYINNSPSAVSLLSLACNMKQHGDGSLSFISGAIVP